MFKSKHESEIAAHKYLSGLGYDVIKRGHPDFIAVDWQTKTVRFIEIKRGKERLKPHQEKVKSIYEMVGLKYETLRMIQADGNYEVLEIN